MALVMIVEDGTGEVVGANSYISLAAAKTYWDNSRFDWTIYPPDAQLEGALIAATRYIELRFRQNFLGYRLLGLDQPLSWPRQCIILYGSPVEGVPQAVKDATCEYARIHLTQPGGLFPIPAGFDATGQIIQESHVKVGPVEKKLVFEAGSATVLRSYPTIDGLLNELIWWSGGVIRN